MIAISHRGYSSVYPENTLIAFEQAWRHGFDWVELDIALTRDRQMVVLHDDGVERTSGGTGRVAKMTLAELRRLDFGSWKHKDFAGEKIPLLSEVFQHFAGKLSFNVEIKSGFYEEKESPRSIENQLRNLAVDYGMNDEILVSSFDHRYLFRLAEKEPRLRLGLLVAGEGTAEIRNISGRCRFFSVHVSKENVNEEWVAFARESDLKIFVYTVNEEVDYRRVEKLGVDGIFTDGLGWK